VVCDKGYDSRANRDLATTKGIRPVIPPKRTSSTPQKHFPKALYHARVRIEQAVGKLKRFKRVALRCEKTAQNYRSITAFALFLVLAKSVHTA